MCREPHITGLYSDVDIWLQLVHSKGILVELSLDSRIPPSSSHTNALLHWFDRSSLRGTTWPDPAINAITVFEQVDDSSGPYDL